MRLRWEWTTVASPLADSPTVTETDSSCTLTWPSEGEYTVALGADPRVVCRAWGVTPHEAACSAVMWLIPAALPLLELEPLHGAALAFGSAGLLLLGHTGAGKTTLSVELQRLEFGLLADDVCALDRSGGLHVGAPLQSVAKPFLGAQVVAAYDDKWLIRAPRPQADSVPAATTVILEATPGAPLALEVLRGVDAFRAIAQHVRRPSVFASRREAGQLAVISRLCEERVARMSYDPLSHEPGRVAEALAAWVGEG